jgi:hypothetical protein
MHFRQTTEKYWESVTPGSRNRISHASHCLPWRLTAGGSINRGETASITESKGPCDVADERGPRIGRGERPAHAAQTMQMGNGAQ